MPPFPRITYDEAVDRIKGTGMEFQWGEDFGAEHETILSEQFDRPVMIHRYPQACKPFYMEIDPDDERLSLSVDMLAPEGYGEIIGGGQRMTNLSKLEARMDADGSGDGERTAEHASGWGGSGAYGVGGVHRAGSGGAGERPGRDGEVGSGIDGR